MKIYTNVDEFYKTCKYWSNATADLCDIQTGKDIEKSDLPAELLTPYEFLSENYYGMYTYLMQYNGKNGFAFVLEYSEYDDDGHKKTTDNFDYAVAFAQKIEKAFPQHTVFVGKQTGFPYTLDNGIEDNATELVIFIDADFFTDKNKSEFDALVDYLEKNA